MNERKQITKLVREAEFLLEVELEAVVGAADDPWFPAYPPAEALRLYEATRAMRSHDWARARQYGRLYRTELVAA